MTHSQQPSIDIIKSKIQRISGIETKLFLLYSVLEAIQSLPQEQTTDELLEDTKYNFSLYNMWTYWVAQTDEKTSSWPTPRLALMELKEKLSTNL